MSDAINKDEAKQPSGIRQIVGSDTSRRFDVKTLPEDIQRVFGHLKKLHGEEYALTVVFIIRTIIELHRAWHITLLTSKIVQQVKDEFGIRMTWDLGVFRIKFRMDDGGWELHRKVPYDYDSEYQDIYMRIAVALTEGQINVHEALIYQTETKNGLHTAKSGLFLRSFPGRLVLYPLLSMSCCVIFFGGDWTDGGIAALTGFATGVIEYFLSEGLGGEATVLNDIIVGTATGVIASLFWRFQAEEHCLSAIFLGTLYWYFYGTAFVVGILEIITGELETGVTRFIAVSVKTFVLCLGAGFGMLITLEDASTVWLQQSEHCGTVDLDDEWWRIPLYLLSSAAALGQYRFPLVGYWRGLAVQLVGYEVQYQFQKYFDGLVNRDNLDTASSNVMGAAAAVCAACGISYIVDQMRYYYYGRLLVRDDGSEKSAVGNMIYKLVAGLTSFTNAIGMGRKADVAAQNMAEKVRSQSTELNDPNHARSAIELTKEEEGMIVGILVDAQDHNIWAVLMPAVYQLVPGSMIAKLWFNSIFPPPLVEQTDTIDIPGGGSIDITSFQLDSAQDNVFSSLMVISTSLALGLIIGFAIVQAFEAIFCGCGFCEDTATDIYGGSHKDSRRKRKQARTAGMYTADNDDPMTDEEGEDAAAADEKDKELEESKEDEQEEAPSDQVEEA